MSIVLARHARKLEWQRAQRRKFAAERGYSTASNYATDGLRESVLERDGRACVHCGMTAAEHYRLWSRPITVDHINRDRTHNTMENLQTLCLRCHGKKDIPPTLIVQKIPSRKADVIQMRQSGATYQQIADALGFSIGAVWKWLRR